jgi:hypothetical protein
MAVLYNSNFDLTIPFSDVCVQVALVANIDQTFTVPGTGINKYAARFTYSSNSNVFVGYNNAPTTPPGNTVGVQAYNEFKPGYDRTQRYVQGGDVLHFNSPDAAGAYVGISLRALPG